MTPLSPKRRSDLRAEAHKLSPVVIIGDKGLTDEVLAEIDRSLKAHELIKVRAATDERDARSVWIETICDRLEAHPVQQIGKIFVIYRENPEAKEAEGGKQGRDGVGAERKEKRRGPRANVVTERGELRQHSRDLDKRREADVKDMIRKGKIKPKPEIGTATGLQRDDAARARKPAASVRKPIASARKPIASARRRRAS